MSQSGVRPKGSLAAFTTNLVPDATLGHATLMTTMGTRNNHKHSAAPHVANNQEPISKNQFAFGIWFLEFGSSFRSVSIGFFMPNLLGLQEINLVFVVLRLRIDRSAGKLVGSVGLYRWRSKP